MGAIFCRHRSKIIPPTKATPIEMLLWLVTVVFRILHFFVFVLVYFRGALRRDVRFGFQSNGVCLMPPYSCLSSDISLQAIRKVNAAVCDYCGNCSHLCSCHWNACRMVCNKTTEKFRFILIVSGFNIYLLCRCLPLCFQLDVGQQVPNVLDQLAIFCERSTSQLHVRHMLRIPFRTQRGTADHDQALVGFFSG